MDADSGVSAADRQWTVGSEQLVMGCGQSEVDRGQYMWVLDTVQSLQSHMILTMSHWSSGLTCLHPVTRVTGSNPLGGYLCESGILL